MNTISRYTVLRNREKNGAGSAGRKKYTAKARMRLWLLLPPCCWWSSRTAPAVWTPPPPACPPRSGSRYTVLRNREKNGAGSAGRKKYTAKKGAGIMFDNHFSDKNTSAQDTMQGQSQSTRQRIGEERIGLRNIDHIVRRLLDLFVLLTGNCQHEFGDSWVKHNFYKILSQFEHN